MTSMLFPETGFGRISVRPEEVLLLCYYDPKGVSTVPETVAYLQVKSQFSVSVLNLFEHRQSLDGLELSPELNLNKFAAVVIHNTVSYNVDNLRSLDRLLPTRLAQFNGVKILLKQDENYRFKEMARYIGEVGFDVIFTCLPSDAVDKIYPVELVGEPRFVRMLTGYVTPSLRSISASSSKRPIDIGYRGSIQPLSFGRLAFEKRKIGDDVESLLSGKNISLDISSRWEDRIGGAGWFKFLASCKATLGAESGASVFDLDGDLDSRCRLAEEELGAFRDDHDYAESYLSYLKDLEGNVYYNQLSPRHFEAIATQTLQLLYPGTYSGILQPEKHYFSLNRDYSNLQEGLELLLDEPKRKEVVTRAYEEILLNETYWIETFVQNVDEEIAVALEKKGISVQPSYKSSSAAINVLLIAAHEPRIDPRLDWIASHATSPLRIHQCGILLPDKEIVIRETMSNGAMYQATPRLSYKRGMWLKWLRMVSGDPAGVAAVQEILFLEQALGLPELEFAELFAAPAGCERLSQFRWYVRYFLDTTASLLSECFAMRGVHAVIATDLDTLLPALVLKAVFKVPVFYDAHEYWAESDVNSFEFENNYWIALEKRLVGYADHRQIVSPGLAKMLGEQYHCSFDCLPNCEPLVSNRIFADKLPESADELRRCTFVFQGGFSQGRGLDLLINAWVNTSERAILLLRGRDTEYKAEMIKLAEKTGLLGSRIFFPEPVDETDMIRSASKSDVGIAPYPPINNLYANCSPNKLSQYMAAGIPILANDTNFVRDVITEGQCGIVVDFSRVADLVSAVNRLSLDTELRNQMAASGFEYYSNTFNWQKVSGSFYRLLQMTASEQKERFFLYPCKNECYYEQSQDLCEKIQDLFVVPVTNACLSAIENDSASNRAGMIRRCLRPMWLKLPEPFKAKIRSAIVKRL